MKIVISAIRNLKNRYFIRNSWGNPLLYNYTGFKTVFLVGVSNNSKFQLNINNESATFKDIIQVEVVDSYKNLTYKTTSLIVWAEKYCSHVPFIIKIDDDTLLKPYELSLLLKREVNAKINMNKIIGSQYPGVSPSRTGKYAVPEEEFIGVFPNYVQGSLYIIPTTIISALKESISKTRYVKYLQ